MLRIFNAGLQSSGLRRHRHSTQFRGNFKKQKALISRKKIGRFQIGKGIKFTAQRVEGDLQALLKA
jgi:hypothetical protein